MKTLASCLLIVSAIGTIPVWAEPMSETDRRFAIEHLKKTQNTLEGAVGGLSEAQLKFVSGPDRWCIQQIAEHLAIAEDNWWNDLKTIFQRAPIGPDKKAKHTDDEMANLMTDRTNKVQATGIWAPDGRWKNIRDILAHFAESRTRMIEFLATTPEDLRHRVLLRDGQDTYQYILGVSYHVERHLQQIAEVKADAKYPK